MSVKPFVDEGSSLLDVIRTAMAGAVAEDDRRSRIELVKFSGDSNDVIRKDDRVYLRCTSARMRDGEGVPVPFVARLASVGGEWWIPPSACELVAFVPEDAARAIGAAYVLPLGVSPPKKLEVGATAYQDGGDATVAKTAKKFLWKAPGGGWFGFDDSGLTIAWPNGTRLVFKDSGFQVVIMDATGIGTVFDLGAEGLTFTSGPGGTPKMLVKWDGSSGMIHQLGLGPFIAQFVAGLLGLAPSNGIMGTGATGVSPSATWAVSP